MENARQATSVITYSGFLSRVQTFTNCLKIEFCGENFHGFTVLIRHGKASIESFPSVGLPC